MPAPASLSRNVAVLSAGQFLSRVVAFAVTIHLTRALQAEGFGTIALAMGVLAYGAVLVELGFDSLGPLEVARGRLPVADLARTVVALRLLLAALGCAAVAAFAALAPFGRPARLVISLYGLSLLANALDLGWVFLGAERMRPVALSEIAQQLVLAVGVFAFVTGPEHLMRVPFLFLLSRLCGVGGVMLAFARRYGACVPRLDFGLLRQLLPTSLPLSGSVAVGTLLQNFDLVLVGVWLGSRAAGLYGAAYRVVWVPTIVATAYFTALRPVLARGSVSGLESVADVLRRSSRVAVALGLGAAVGGLLLADGVMRTLFGAEYAAGAGPLAVLLAAFGLQVLSRHYRAVLIAFHHQAADLRVMLAAAALNVGLNLAWIPRFGLLGAAYATLASEALILAASLRLGRRVGSLPFLGSALRPLACLVPMALVLIAVRPWPLAAQVACGGAVYVALLLLLRVVRVDELRRVIAR